MRVSVVIPALNEAGNIGRLVEETYAAVPAGVLAEVIVVDDCSTDGTGAEIKALIKRGTLPGLRYLRHGARSGQSTAMRTGILAAKSPVIATMDGDGQNDPRDIPKLLTSLADPAGTKRGGGVALVGGWRTKREDTGSKRYASKAANWIRDSVLKDQCPDTGCGIKVYWRDAFLLLPFFTSMHRYLPALFITYGHKVAYVPVNDRARVAGVSKYNNLNRALVGIYDLVGVSWVRKRTKTPDVTEES
jgi:dolichol-phosphate mannosyltransferase